MPKRKPAKRADAPPAPRGDGWQNLLTGIGDANRDKRLSSTMQAERLEYEDALELYRSDDMASRIVDALPEEMCRKWFDTRCADDAELGEQLDQRLDELDAPEKFQQALSWSRAYGGAGVVVGVNDGLDPAEPVDPARIKSIDWLTVLDIYELRPVVWYSDPLAPRYGDVAMYRIMPQWVAPSETVSSVDLPGGQGKGALHGSKARPTKGKGMLAGPLPLVHESRVLRFEGVLVNRRQRHERLGWGDSVLNRVNNVLRDYQVSWHSVAALLQDFSQSVFKMKGLAEIIAANGSAQVVNRIQTIDLMRSILRSVLIDSEDTYERTQTPVSGLDDLMVQFSLRLAAAARMPVSLLMGQAPAGLNATGDSDIRWFYDQIGAAQKKHIKPAAQKLLKLLFAEKQGPAKGREPEKWSVDFRPLWQLSDLEESQRRLNIANADKLYTDSGVLTPEEVATSRFGGDGYGSEIQLVEADPEKRALAAQEQAEGEAEQQAKVAAAAKDNSAKGAPGGHEEGKQS